MGEYKDNSLNIYNEDSKKVAFKWLVLSGFALALSGVFAVFLVIARSPKIHKLLPYPDFFKTTLTIHVNLSVLVWLLSICVFYIVLQSVKENFLQKTAFTLSLIGTLIIAFSIFDNSAEAFLNNYVPFLNSKTFEVGIISFLGGILIISVNNILGIRNLKNITYQNFLSIILISAFIVFLLTFLDLKNNHKNLYSKADYYEVLYWGFGHILQYAYSFIMIIAWLLAFKYLSLNENKNINLSEKINAKILRFHTILSVIGITIIAKYYVSDFEYKNYYTKHMAIFGGLSTIFIFMNNFKNFKALITIKNNIHIKNAILWSVILFFTGGLISMTIHGSDTRIPAHYHGSIVGVSLGLMALFYISLERFGYILSQSKILNLQPLIYGAGQLIHITGLAISGGYGALRKQPGVMESFEGKFYMGLMGFGGLLSVIGGLLFVIIIFKTILTSNSLKI